jgi:hypothetical protein
MAKRVSRSRTQPSADPSSGVNSAQAARPLLQRILDTPQLAQVIPRLPGEVLHRVIERCGLEDCSEVVALATPAQLLEVFDLDLWRPGEPGHDELFDAARFGVWLRVLVEAGAAAAASKLARIDSDLLVTAFAEHVRVFDPAAMTLTTEDGEEIPLIRADDDLRAEMGGYLVVARREDAWDAVVDVLDALSSFETHCFHKVMRGCRRLSNADPEVDGLDDLLTDPEQGMFDVIVEREQRRDKKGYLSPAQARAFLQEARQRDLSTAVPPAPGAVARAYFAGIEPPPLEDTPDDVQAGTPSSMSDSPAVTGTATDRVTELLDVLRDAGVVPQPPRALLESPNTADSRLALLHAYMRAVYERDYATYLKRGGELAYLANVLVAACPLQGRAMTPQEASDAVAATCNLGLENFPPQWAVSGESFGGPKDPLRHELPHNHDLIRIFEVGWAVLHRDVCVYAAGQLLNVLRQLRVADPETQAALDTLRMGLRRHGDNGKPWLVRDDLDVIALLDLPAWAALLGLIDQCPSIHAAIVSARDRRVLSVSASFEFIALTSQLDSVRDYLGSLPQRLGP